MKVIKNIFYWIGIVILGILLIPFLPLIWLLWYPILWLTSDPLEWEVRNDRRGSP